MRTLSCPTRQWIETVSDIDAELEPHPDVHIVHVPVIRKIAVKQMRADLQSVVDTDPTKPLMCVTPANNTEINRLCPLLWLKKLCTTTTDELGDVIVWDFQPPRR